MICASCLSAGTISFTGTFGADDDKQVFLYSIPNAGSVTVSTTSFATGGFIPILSLFDAGGNFLFLDSGYANNTDASLNFPAAPGAVYTIVLTEYDNFPNGLQLSQGFAEDGNGNFTTGLSGFPGPFRDPLGTQLTGDWAVTFASADPGLQATAVPEPGAVFLAGGGMLLLFLRKKRAA